MIKNGHRNHADELAPFVGWNVMRPNLKIAALTVSAFVAGIALGVYGSPRVQVSQTPHEELRVERDELAARLQEVEEKRNHLQTELARIASVDFADYQRLQNEEAQFMKAKEILGKVFLILFHNVLAGVSDDQKQFAQALASGQELDSSVSVPVPTPEKSSVPLHPPVAPAGGDAPLKSPVVGSAVWTQAERDFSSVNPEKADAFLQSTVIKDIMAEQVGSRPFRDDDTRLQAMQGYYTGELIFLDPKKKPWSMELSLSSETRNGKHTGSFMVRIVDEHGNQSRLGQEGGITELIKPVSDSKALIVRVYKTEFLQMYIFEKQGLIIGNYYNEVGDGKVEHLGRFKLSK